MGLPSSGGASKVRRPGKSPLRLGIILFFAAVALTAVSAAEHPTLVDIESAVCTVCHEEIFEEREVLHGVAEDCSMCHEMTVGDGGTEVALADAEPALCLMCHDDLTSAVEGELDSPHAPVTQSCLLCHDPHASDEPKLLLSSLGSLCGTCHEGEDLAEPHGDQLTPSTNCVSCHRPHGSATAVLLAGAHLHVPFADGSCTGCHRKPFGDRVRLRTRGERLCEACHGAMDETDSPNGSVHAALKGEKGRAGCLACHDPHMGDQPKLLRVVGPDVCDACHGEVVAAARAETGHYPAAEDCGNCHSPHTADQPALLNADAGELCSGCHDLADEALGTAHLGADPAALECVSCHTPHGSGHPKLLATTLHPPVLDGCEMCHEGSHDELMEDGESALCLVCHDDVGELAAQSPVPHAALEMGTCADCHNPHASAQASLLAAPGDAVCANCHEDQAPGEGEVAHGVIDLLGCQACHEPHGGEREKLLRAETTELCLGCHDPSRVNPVEDQPTVTVLDRFELAPEIVRAMASLRLTPDGQFGHPTESHRVLGTPTDEKLRDWNIDTDHVGELTCVTCHDPHKGRSKLILRWNARSSAEACRNCHPDK
jgi:predicted CXXCH cytochrome family protein